MSVRAIALYRGDLKGIGREMAIREDGRGVERFQHPGPGRGRRLVWSRWYVKPRTFDPAALPDHIISASTWLRPEPNARAVAALRLPADEAHSAALREHADGLREDIQGMRAEGYYEEARIEGERLRAVEEALHDERQRELEDAFAGALEPDVPAKGRRRTKRSS
jgi:hypothetical protein